MSDLTPADKIEKACQEAHEKLLKLNPEAYSDVISKLEFVLVSYKADNNPVGLYEIGAMALDTLKEAKKEKPRQVSKKLIESLEKAIALQEA